MPELPEVQTVVNTLLPRVLNAHITQAQLLHAGIVRPAGTDLPRHLRGRRIIAIDRRGKRIVVALQPAGRLLIHLGMTGRLTVRPVGAERRLHTHMVLHLARPHAAPLEVHFCDPRRFGYLRWLHEDEQADAGLGPEPLNITTADLAQRLSRTARPVKAALMDQRVIAGLGNIYVDESLFLAHIHPLTPCKRLSVAQARSLRRAIVRTLQQAIESHGSTVRDYADAAGASGWFQHHHKVYGKATQPCTRCRTPIVRIVVGGRSTCYCPACQKPPAVASKA